MLDESIGVLKETVSIEQSNNWSSGIFSKREAKSNACKEAVNGVFNHPNRSPSIN